MNFNLESFIAFRYLKSKRDEIIFKMKLVSKEEVDILNKRISKLENQVDEIKKIKSKRKTKRAKRS